jgi:isopenicillin N synthase-like dioxygenase
MTTSIPVIDLSGALSGSEAAKRETANEIDRTCREIGFFTIKGHGVSATAMADLRTQANAFFALPLAEKLRAAPPDPTLPRGYRALGIEALSYGNDIETPPDLKEFYHFGRETWTDEPYYTQGDGPTYFIKNIWPVAPAGFAAAADRYYREVEQLAARMMSLTALALGKPETFFADKLDRHITAMRLNFYPEQTSAPKPGQLRAGDHTDYGLFTILNGENVPGGLQVRTRSGAWSDVATDPETFVVNIGDLLMRWTNDRWVSNVHRVINPPDSVAARSKRLSIAFFQHPNYDALIECVAPPGQAKYPPVLSGQYRSEKYAQTHVKPAAA